MTNKSKNIGTAAETAVVKYLKTNGFPHAKRLVLQGANDIGDVSLGDGWPITIEVKGGKEAESASDAQIIDWLAEAHREADKAGNGIALLVLKRKGKSAANAGQWWAILDTTCYLELLGAAAPDDWTGTGGVWRTTLEFIAFAIGRRTYELLDLEQAFEE